MKKALEDLKKLKEYIESENRLGDLDYAHYSVMIDYIDEAIEELEALENRSCINCKYSSVRFNIDCNLINKLDLPENFCCNKWENKA